MNRKILAAEVILALMIALGFRYAIQPKPALPLSRTAVYKNKIMAFCSPDWSLINTDSLAAAITPLKGWGDYRWAINTKSDSAQFYFNQGINMYYAFHIIESIASFKKAEIFDNTNPLIYWAQALAYGPNINDFAYAPSADALLMAQKAKALSASVSAAEKALINAMLVRYTSDTTISRTDLNAAYSKAMKEAYDQHSNNANVVALYADALMLQHPWEYWKHNGDPHPWTPELLEVIQKGLAFAPQHPGLNHYYIHATEASPNPGRALESADRLGVLMPGVSHMVHMPSHIYIRTGNYQKGITVNQMSVSGYKNYLSAFPEVEKNVGLYLIHNLHMQSACAMFQLDYNVALKSAEETRASFDTSYLSLPQPMGNFIQYVYMTPQFVKVRYGKWNELLADADVPANYAYAHVLSLWSKGMASAATGKIPKAIEYLERMHEAMKQEDLKIVLAPFNAPISSAKVAEQLLKGIIHHKTSRLQLAIDNFAEAVKLEDSLIYNEPRDWLLPSRHYLANALIEKRDFARAQKILKEDLVQNPQNIYALNGLVTVFRGSGKIKEAGEIQKRISKLYPLDLYPPPLLSY